MKGGPTTLISIIITLLMISTVAVMPSAAVWFVMKEIIPLLVSIGILLLSLAALVGYSKRTRRKV